MSPLFDLDEPERPHVTCIMSTSIQKQLKECQTVSLPVSGCNARLADHIKLAVAL